MSALSTPLQELRLIPNLLLSDRLQLLPCYLGLRPFFQLTDNQVPKREFYSSRPCFAIPPVTGNFVVAHLGVRGRPASWKTFDRVFTSKTVPSSERTKTTLSWLRRCCASGRGCARKRILGLKTRADSNGKDPCNKGRHTARVLPSMQYAGPNNAERTSMQSFASILWSVAEDMV